REALKTILSNALRDMSNESLVADAHRAAAEGMESTIAILQRRYPAEAEQAMAETYQAVFVDLVSDMSDHPVTRMRWGSDFTGKAAFLALPEPERAIRFQAAMSSELFKTMSRYLFIGPWLRLAVCILVSGEEYAEGPATAERSGQLLSAFMARMNKIRMASGYP